MINLREKEVLCDIAINTKTYGSEMPTRIKNVWICPHCNFEHNNLDQLAAHLAAKCDN